MVNEQIKIQTFENSEIKYKKRINNTKVTFKPYEQNQLMIPTNWKTLIPKDHIVNMINDIVDNMNIETLLQTYLPGGTSTYNPRMMLKVTIYGYIDKKFSSRQIAKAIRENIYFMWLAGGNRPDFRTVNDFRSNKMKDIIEEVFTEVLMILFQEGYIDLKNYFVDGTKIEANANKYTFVWRGSVEKYRDSVQLKVKNLIKQIDEINAEEDKIFTAEEELQPKEITPKKLKDFAERLSQKLNKTEEKSKEEKKKDKKIEKAITKIETDFEPRLRKYEKDLEIMGEKRNSYSKTDHDATFMRMKEDHMRNGQLKPGYNVQIGVQNEFIINYSIHQDRNDNGCLIPHLKKLQENTNRIPENICADSGYGNQENYEYIKGKEIGNYVKYPLFHKEQKKSFKKQIYRIENLTYDKEKDEYICPAGKKLKYEYTTKSKTQTGYVQEIKMYECEDCSNYINKADCTKASGNRKIGVNEELNEYKTEVRSNLLSEYGKELRSKRPEEVERTFGQIKWNNGFKRFLLRGIEKIELEWGWISIAHNLKKLSNKIKRNSIKIEIA